MTTYASGALETAAWPLELFDQPAILSVFYDLIMISESASLITHVVLFKLIHPTPANLEKTKEVLMNMKGKIPQLRDIVVGIDLLRSARSYDLALITEFSSMEDLKIYQEHPLHQEVLTYMTAVRESSISVDFQQNNR